MASTHLPSLPTPSLGTAASARGGRSARGVRLTAFVVAAAVAVWWLATGALLALQRSAATRAVELGVAIAAGIAGWWIAASVARRGAVSAVVAGVLLWTSVAAAFYGGWIVGPALPPATPGAAPTWGRAAAAVLSTAWSAAYAAAILLFLIRTSRPNARRAATPRGAPWYAAAAFGVLWGAHELAKLNVFLGVASPGSRYLPPYLAHLAGYFGPARNSALLPASVVALGGAAVWLAARARRRDDASARTATLLLAAILALAAFEHAALGTAAPPAWWDGFLAWRGGA